MVGSVDSHGDPNLLEFASGADPGTSNSTPLTFIGRTNAFVRVLYQADTNAEGTVSWVVESTLQTAGPWSNRAGAAQPVASNGSLRTMQFVPSGANPTNENYRLKITLP